MSAAALVPVAADDLAHLRALVEATEAVLVRIELLDSCRFGPVAVVDAGIADLEAGLVALDGLIARPCDRSLSAIAARLPDGPEGALGAQLVATTRSNVARIRERSRALHLELRRMMADTRAVVSLASGGAGTYDATGQTAIGQLRRGRGQA